MLYAVRKRRGQWIVCADESVVLQFETYDEAVATARGAVTVLASRTHLQPAPDDGHDARSEGVLDDALEPGR
jgi:hypothetical protein